MNTSGLLQILCELTLQEIRSIHDSMNIYFLSNIPFQYICEIKWITDYQSKIKAFPVTNHLAEEERAGCFTLIVLWLSVLCVSSSLCHRLVCNL